MIRTPTFVAITDESLGDEKLRAVCEAACAAGCGCIQLRAKHASGRELYDLALALRKITKAHGALLLINERCDVALAVGADGVHLPAQGLSAKDARCLLGKDALVGRSVHSVAEIKALAGCGLSYVQFGPVYSTPSKARFGAPQGLGALGDAVRAARVAGLGLVAVGGIKAHNMGAVRGCGVDGIAVISEIMRVQDPAAATQTMLSTSSNR